jgi:hypothetical protein
MDSNQIKQTIGQIERSVTDAGTIMNEQEFSEYCDKAYALIAKWRKVLMTSFFE